MAPGNSGGAEGAGGANEFGCELSLGQDLAKNNFPTQTVYLIKVSMGGTTLALDHRYSERGQLQFIFDRFLLAVRGLQ